MQHIASCLLAVTIGLAPHLNAKASEVVQKPAEQGAAGAGFARLTGANTPLKAGAGIAFYGDSITMQGGYIDTIKKALAGSPATRELGIKIFQHGLNGGRVPTIMAGECPWGKFGATMQELLVKEQPNVVVIFAGVNDVWHGEKGTTPEDFESGLRKMVSLCKDIKAPVVLATLATIGEKPDGSNGHDKKLDQYAELTLKVAADTGSTPVDIRKAFVDYLKANNTGKDEKGQYKDKGFLTYDGVHMNEKGNELLTQLISAGIVESLK